MEISKEMLGWLGVGCALFSYILYPVDILRSRSKPHAFSWFLWTLLAATAFAAQVADGAGAGSWVLATDTVFNGLIFVLALARGEKGYTFLDWVALIFALLSLLLWWATSTPLYSVMLICLVDAFSYAPTFRKSYSKPREEHVISYVLFTLKYIPALFALEHYSFITVLYPAWVMLMNVAFVAMLVIRRACVAH